MSRKRNKTARSKPYNETGKPTHSEKRDKRNNEKDEAARKTGRTHKGGRVVRGRLISSCSKRRSREQRAVSRAAFRFMVRYFDVLHLFVYFTKRILPKIDPRQQEFRWRCGRMEIGER